MGGGNNLYVRGQVEMILKDKGLVDMKTRLESLEKSAAKTARGVEGLGASAAKAGAMLAGFLSAGALISFAKTAVLEFAKVDRAFSTIGIQLEALGLSSERELPRIKAALTAIESAGGPILEETVPAFNKFLLITGDVTKALFLAKFAADLSETGMTDIGGAVEVLNGLLRGNTKAAFSQFGAILDKTTGKGADAATVFKVLYGKFDDLVNRTNDAQDQVDKLSVAWAQFSRSGGAGLVPVLTWVLKLFSSIPSSVGAMVAHVKLGFSEMAETINSFRQVGVKGLFTEAGQKELTALRIATTMHFRGLHDDVSTKWSKDMAEVWGQAGADAGKAEGTGHAKELDELLSEMRRAKVREAEEAAKEGAAKIRKVIDDELARMRATVKDIEDDRKRRLDERIKKDLSGDEGVDAIAQKYKFVDQLRAQQKGFVEDLLAQMQETGPAMFNLQRIQLETWYQEQRELARGNAAALGVIDQRYIARKRALESAQLKWEKMAAAEKREAALNASSAVLGSLSQLFPKVKAFAIAQAIINTYQAATAALGSPPWTPANFALAAATIITGLAQVQQIRKTNTGFDDPAHDRLARIGGYRWAGDMVREFMRGSTEGWGAAMQNPIAAAASTVSQTSITNAPSYGGSTINIKVGWMDDIMLTKLKRELETITQRDRVRGRQ